ncbi:MAG: EF-hand domain-containing protein [Planctomycetes bacterium]|nr:EF-hand domain-containing protein [Planctomycetota bacterium]
MSSYPFTVLALALLGLAAAQDRGAGPAAGRGAQRGADASPQRGADTGAQRGADREERLRQAREKELEQQAEAAFTVADRDENGWISFREARESMQHDRARFAAFDHDGDGRITREEFTQEYVEAVQRVGAFKPPQPDPDDPDAPTVAELLAEEHAPEATEPEPTAEAPVEPTAIEPGAPAPRKSVYELFGRVEPREEVLHGTPEPDRIVGPVPTFRRLDYDGDGGITRADLTELARGSSLEPRLNTLLATLDTNGDGRIDATEFRASMRHED